MGTNLLLRRLCPISACGWFQLSARKSKEVNVPRKKDDILQAEKMMQTSSSVAETGVEAQIGAQRHFVVK